MENNYDNSIDTASPLSSPNPYAEEELDEIYAGVRIFIFHFALPLIFHFVLPLIFHFALPLIFQEDDYIYSPSTPPRRKATAAVEATKEPEVIVISDDEDEPGTPRTPTEMYSDAEGYETPTEEAVGQLPPAPTKKRGNVDLDALETLLNAAQTLDIDLVVEHHRYIRRCVRANK